MLKTHNDFKFQLVPQCASVHYEVELVDFPSFKLDGLGLPRIVTQVGSNTIEYRICLYVDLQNRVRATLEYAADDIKHDIMTRFVATYKDGRVERFSGTMPLGDGIPEIVTVISDFKFHYYASEYIPSLPNAPPRPQEQPVHRTALLIMEDGQISFDANFLAASSPIFRTIVDTVRGSPCKIEIPSFDYETVSLALTFLRGDTPYRFTRKMRKKVLRFAKQYMISSIEPNFPIVIAD